MKQTAFQVVTGSKHQVLLNEDFVHCGSGISNMCIRLAYIHNSKRASTTSASKHIRRYYFGCQLRSKELTERQIGKDHTSASYKGH